MKDMCLAWLSSLQDQPARQGVRLLHIARLCQPHGVESLTLLQQEIDRGPHVFVRLAQDPTMSSC